jgi:hypothetical protein
MAQTFALNSLAFIEKIVHGAGRPVRIVLEIQS